ncbi:MAG: flavodoxin family protein [Spirochaetota bacterium]
MKQVRILGINGSPKRKGSTRTLMEWVLEGCREAGAETELINITDYRIEYCIGCHRCLKEGSCFLSDEYGAVFEKLMGADGIVVGSPVYEGMPTAQLKTLLDRMTLLNLYAATFSDKLSVGVATSGIAPPRGTARTAAGMFGSVVGIIGAKTATLKGGMKHLEERHDPGLPRKARRLGGKLVKKALTSERKRFSSLKAAWIYFLRKYLLKKLVTRFPEDFRAAIEMNPDLYGP